MPVHWTDFPGHVERFGDLFDIFQTFADDLRADTIDSGMLARRGPEAAYDVEFMGLDRIVPRPDRVPGWEALATYTEREFHTPPTLPALRQVRGRASEGLDVGLDAVNAMTIAAVVETLAAADRSATAGAGGADDPFADVRWLKVTQIEALFGVSKGQVSKLGDTGVFVTNGQTGHDRRIDVLSVVRWSLHRLAQQAGPPG